MNIYKKLVSLFVVVFLVSLVPKTLFAGQLDIPKPPSINCPVSLYDQARKIKGQSATFSSLQDFSDFFSFYKRFVAQANSLTGSSYYVLKFDVPTSAGWRLEYYESPYNLPTFNSTNTPVKTYPVFLGPRLPTPFMLNIEEVKALNTIYITNKPLADTLISDIWLLNFFEQSCFQKINNLEQIPENPKDIGTGGYGTTRANSQSFDISIPTGDLWTETTVNSFTVKGSITARKPVTASLLIAYGADRNNLNFLAPTDGALFFNSPMAENDTVAFTPITVLTAPIKEAIKDNTIYFAIVDSHDKTLSYTGTEALSLGKNTGLTSYQLDQPNTQAAPAQTVIKNGGLMKGICSGSDCGFKDIIQLFKNFWKFILFLIVPLIALMTAWIGFNFMKTGAEYQEKAKEMLGNMVTGVLLIIFAWFIVKTILDFTVGKGSCYSFLGSGKVDPECVEGKK